MPKSTKGQGIILFFENIEVIEHCLSIRMNSTLIYKKVITNNNHTLSYSQFARLIQRYKNEGKNKKLKGKPSQIKRNISSSKPKTKPTGFYHNPTMDDERLKEIFGE
jgi:hypothetical protein